MSGVLYGNNVMLKGCTNELWHDYYKGYTVDPMMDTTTYVYDFERLEKAYQLKTSDETRLYFFIIHGQVVVGQIYLKHMDRAQKTTEFGIALINDSVKGKGFGTEAIKLLIDYTFNSLDFKIIKADSVHRNTRSRHVLEKLGFKFTHKDDIFIYYQLER